MFFRSGELCCWSVCVYGVPWGSPTQPYTLRLRVDGFLYCFILQHLLFNVLCCATVLLSCVVLCCVVFVCYVVFVVVVVVVPWCAAL